MRNVCGDHTERIDPLSGTRGRYDRVFGSSHGFSYIGLHHEWTEVERSFSVEDLDGSHEEICERQKKVWELCNPDIPRSELQKPLTEPVMPPQPTPDQDGKVSEEAIMAWSDDCYDYEPLYAKWWYQMRALYEVNEFIIRTLDSIHHSAVLEFDTPYDRLLYLKYRFAPLTATQIRSDRRLADAH